MTDGWPSLRRIVLGLTVPVWLCCAVITAPCEAGAADFDPQAQDWTGLSLLLETASMVSLQLTVGDRLDWSTLDEHAILLLIAPQIGVDAETQRNLERFLESGGRLIVADDFAQGGQWLQPFGLDLVAEPGTSEKHYDEIEGLPQVDIDPEPATYRVAMRWMAPGARITPADFLGHNLHAPVVLNHPASIRVQPHLTHNAAIWGHYRELDRGWLAEVDRGAGRVLAIADSSVFINAMLTKLHDNKQFAANVMRYYCVADRPCKVLLLPTLARVTGTFTPRVPPPRDASLRSGLEQLQQMLAWLAEALRGPLAAPALLFLILVWLGIPIVRLARSPTPLLPPQPTEQRRDSILAESVTAWLSQAQADFRRPARLLASHLARVAGQLEQWPGGRSASAAHARKDGLTTTGFGLGIKVQAIDSLVRAGQCSEQAGQRLRLVVASLQSLTHELADPLDRTRFGQLAAEVEWAESLIRHTARVVPDTAQELGTAALAAADGDLKQYQRNSA